MSQNPYESSAYSYPATASQAGVEARTAFIQRTYLHLLGAVLACVAIDAIILNVFHDQLAPLMGMLMRTPMYWLGVLGAFMVVSFIADRWANSNTSRQMQYVGLGLYVLAEALLLVPLLYIAQNFGGDGVIQSAGLVTAIVFGGLTITVLVTKADFSFLRWAIVAGSFIALGIIVAAVFMGFSLGLWFSGAMVLLASGIILYNTSNILHHYNTDQHVAASLALFASVALLFWYVLQIFMSMDD